MATSKGLNVDQRDELANYQNISDYFTEKSDEYSKNDPLKEEVADLKNNITQLEKVVPDKIKSTKPDTEKKNQLKGKMSHFYDSICSDTLSYAKKNNKIDLAAAVNYKESALLDIPNENFVPTIRSINAAIKPFLSEAAFKGYGITQADLDKGEADAVTFLSYLPEAKSTSSEIVSADAAIEALFEPLRESKTQIGLLMRSYAKNGRKENIPFHEGWNSVKTVIHTGGRITILDGVITNAADSSIKIPRVTVKNLTTGKTVYSNLLGEYRFEKFRSGTFEYEFSAPGYITKKVIIIIQRGKHKTVDVALEAA
jgi:hypothetical protein